jgi:protocatechuate 3,4-dioxygenase beta subunit
MDNDDLPVGRILSRREALALLGTMGAAMLAACAPAQTATSVGSAATQAATSAATQAATNAPTAASAATAAVAATTVSTSALACVVKPEVTEGPYYVDDQIDRSDIRSDPSTGAVKDGTPLLLTYKIYQVSGNGCVPLQGAKVEVWHCDAEGTYSDVSDRGFNTVGQKYLRGFQTTDANGAATFTTIYPGWYSGRTVHIHFKVHNDGTDTSHVFTSQLFFDDSLTDQVFANAPYAAKGQRNTLNSNDSIYQDQLLVAATKTDAGFAATFEMGLQI